MTASLQVVILICMKTPTKNPMPPVPPKGPPTPRNQPALTGVLANTFMAGRRKAVAQPLAMLTVRLRPDLIERAKIRAIKEKSTLQNLAAAAIEAYLKTPLASKGDGR